MQSIRIAIVRLRKLAGIASAVLGVSLPSLATAQSPAPPPLPPGSELIRIEPGMSKPERDRQARAHLHRVYVKRQPTAPVPSPQLPDTTPASSLSPFGANPGRKQ